jgi:hypothetical protein
VSDLRGAVVWAVVPSIREAPFRVYTGPGSEPRIRQAVKAAGIARDGERLSLHSLRRHGYAC